MFKGGMEIGFQEWLEGDGEFMPKPKIVMTYGSFDMLHYGHVWLLQRAKEMGDFLIVGVSDDSFNDEKKKEPCMLGYEERAELVRGLRCVDWVVPEESFLQKRGDFITYKVDVLVMGEDWRGVFDGVCKECGVEVVYLPRTPYVSSTLLREAIRREKES